MASFLNGFFDNLLSGTLNPKGTMGDFRHANYLYTGDSLRLAPKTKFLYHVVFEPSPAALEKMPALSNRHREEINMLVKSAQLPRYQADVDTKNQYNRAKNIQTKINYEPVTLQLHDDNFGITTALMEAYYRYYFKDGTYGAEENTPSFGPRSTYSSSELAKFRYGLDNGSITPFFNSITIFQLGRQQYTGFKLINPIITQWGHDDLDNSSSEPTTNSMTLTYEAVFYSRGAVGQGQPAGFGTSHYDQTPSPLAVSGGGTTSIFGVGGVLDGAGGILNDIATGQFGLDTVLEGVNTVRNARNLTLEGIKEEALGTVGSALGSVAVSGVSNTLFPKTPNQGGSQSATPTQGGESSASDPQYAAKVQKAQANNQRTVSQGVVSDDARSIVTNVQPQEPSGLDNL